MGEVRNGPDRLLAAAAAAVGGFPLFAILVHVAGKMLALVLLRNTGSIPPAEGVAPVGLTNPR